MNIESSVTAATSFQSRTTQSHSTATSSAGVMMTCETCDLVGGPFPAAEAAHLRAIHDRLHHGILAAA